MSTGATAFDLWADFQCNCLPNEHDAGQLKYARMLFYSGALSTLLQLQAGGNRRNKREIDRLIFELRDYLEEK